MGVFNVLCSIAEENLGVVVLPSPQGKIEWSNFVLGRLRLVRTPHLNTALHCWKSKDFPYVAQQSIQSINCKRELNNFVHGRLRLVRAPQIKTLLEVLRASVFWLTIVFWSTQALQFAMVISNGDGNARSLNITATPFTD